jgi:hypothetical protein
MYEQSMMLPPAGNTDTKNLLIAGLTHIGDTDKFQAAMRQTTLKYKQYYAHFQVLESQQFAKLAVENALVSRLHFSSSEEFVRDIWDDLPGDPTLDEWASLFDKPSTKEQDMYRAASSLLTKTESRAVSSLVQDKLQRNPHKSPKDIIEDLINEVAQGSDMEDESEEDDYNELYDHGGDGVAFPDITNQWKSWHGSLLYYSAPLEEILYCKH